MTRRDAGFTLIETVIALGVTSMLALAGTLLMLQTLQSGQQVEARTQDIRAAEIAHNLLRDDLASTIVRLSADPDTFSPPQAFIGNSGNNAGQLLLFVRSNWPNPESREPRSNLQRVEYRLDRGELVRRAWLRPDPSPQTPFVDRVLARNLDAVTLRYFRSGRWSDRWETNTSRLPQMVEITFAFDEDDRLVQRFKLGANP